MKNSTILFLLISLLCVSFIAGPGTGDNHWSGTSSAGPLRNKTDWFSRAKYGLFFHYLPGGSTFQASIDGFDATAFAQDCADAGAAYVILTLGQNNGYYCSPNAHYNHYTSYLSGERWAIRDIPLAVGRALQAKRIRLFLYVSANAPGQDSVAARGFNATKLVDYGSGKNWVYNDTLVNRWSEVIQEWSDRYGPLVSGWWIDGCYRQYGFNETYGNAIVRAAKHGNRSAIVALNPGIGYEKMYDSQDYIAGEDNNILNGRYTKQYVAGAQWHELAFLGATWGNGAPSVTASALINHLKTNVNPNGGVLTIDVPLSPHTHGCRIDPMHLTILKTLKVAIRDR